MKKLTTKEWIAITEQVTSLMAQHRLRMGQAYMNALNSIKPELYKEITQMESIDPFYKDKNLPAFFEYLTE